MNLKEVYKSFWGNFRANRVVQILTASDIVMLSGFGLANPIFAVFVTKQINGGDVFVAGLAGSIFAFFSGLAAIPIASIIDAKKGEKDDFFVMLAGSLMLSISQFMYIFINQPWQLYLIQVFSGIGVALAGTCWSAIFSRHLDKDNIALEWSFYNTTVSLGTAAAAAVGGAVAEVFGFTYLFAVSGTMVLIGSLFLLFIAQKFKASG